jgi:hypothetical protein
LDSDKKTVWIRGTDRNPLKDLEIELRMTHYYDGKQFQKKKYSKLYIEGCSHPKNSEPQSVDLELFIREAINVDKVLRLPTEYILANYSLLEMKNGLHIIDLHPNLSIKESQLFPENMYIIGIRLKMQSNQPIVCLSEIYLGE